MRLNNLDNLGFPASRFYLGYGRLTELMRLDSQGLIQVTIAKNLNSVIDLVNKTILTQGLDIYNTAGFEQLLQVAKVNKSVNLLVQRFKTALGKPTLQGHLPALETGLNATTTTGVLPLMAFTGSFPIARARATPDTLAILC
jgi:hypothetical protein